MNNFSFCIQLETKYCARKRNSVENISYRRSVIGAWDAAETLKVCLLYTTRPAAWRVRGGMIYIKQTKVVYTERESERGTRLKFDLFRPTP